MGYRCGSDPALLWLWCKLAAGAPIGTLAWEPPSAVGTGLKKQKKVSSEVSGPPTGYRGEGCPVESVGCGKREAEDYTDLLPR